jgi:mannose-6-phosphate isomerase-like protein (cupin superfamily)
MKTKLSLIGLALLTITACGGDSPDNEDSSSNGASSNRLSYHGSSYPLKKGLEEFSEPKGSHYRSRFNITDGEYTSVQAQAVAGNLYYTWLARDASVWMYGKFYSPGSTQKLSSGTFSYAPKNVDVDSPSREQSAFFKDARVGFDVNNNGKLDRNSEFFRVVSGTISVEISGKIYTMTINVSLENGESVTGKYSGEFTRVSAGSAATPVGGTQD